ncbi:hypothetical protein EYF80_056260 [Liparis tanakae]|uniref:Uncharacterized protein n=1 Tax=Liparis tanakae TaxID=230148 RepID=A0A4Z2EXI8_9TELE|nr:hypothetical protein EYF80_056260 [Liparis tanakae]
MKTGVRSEARGMATTVTTSGSSGSWETDRPGGSRVTARHHGQRISLWLLRIWLRHTEQQVWRQASSLGRRRGL